MGYLPGSFSKSAQLRTLSTRQRVGGSPPRCAAHRVGGLRHDGYENWTQPDTDGSSYCNDSDCPSTTGYQTGRGIWMARVGQVPPTRIVRRAMDGRCHLCESA